MKTLVLAFAAAVTLGLAAPAFASDSAPRGVAIEHVNLKSQDFSSRHRRHYRHHRHHRHHWYRHHHRHHGWYRHHRHHSFCRTYWRHHHRVTVCR